MRFSPATLFASLYCGAIGLQALIHFREQLQFFRTGPARVYGPSPKFLGIVAGPVVKEPVFVSAGAMFILALGAAAAGISFRLSLAVAVAAFFVYFPPILSLNYLGRKADMIPLVLIAMLAAPARAPHVARVLVS
ncbi:MAG TPA: hypothetical protein VHB50_20720, partial [Bryobacteraceae bacterium]|nr:hypothetical protein [Bryobacteraceae bacterium]